MSVRSDAHYLVSVRSNDYNLVDIRSNDHYLVSVRSDETKEDRKEDETMEQTKHYGQEEYLE